MPRYPALSRFSLSAKLLFGFLIVTAPSLAVITGISLYALRDLTGVNQQLHEITRSFEAVQALETAVARTVTPLSAYFVYGGTGEDRRFEAFMQDVENRLNGCGASACHGVSEQPRVMAETLLPHIREIRRRASVVFAAPGTASVGDKIEILHEINRQSEDANGRLERMGSTLLLRVAALQDEAREVNQRATTLILLSVLAMVMFATATAYVVSRRLLKRVGGLLAGTQHMMEGNLGYRVEAGEGDEIGHLAQSFNTMAQEIQEHRENLERMVQTKTEMLAQAQASLIQSEKLASIGLLAAGVAHELNNPLTSILMNIDLLREDVRDQLALDKELQRIAEDALRCKRIIDDLRDFSRRHDLDIAPTDLNRLVRDALDSMGQQLAAQGIALVTRLGSAMPLVPCDAARMEQVLSNIVLNAIQAMPQGGTLTVSTAVRPRFAEIVVADTGPGVAADIRGKIFDPFFTTKPHGTGLGLSIVYRIMEAHGGTVAVDSASAAPAQTPRSASSGAKVTLSLPLAAKAPAGDTPATH